MAEYLYALIRYVPDETRMEPVNIGVVLQGRGLLNFKLNTQASKRGDFDTNTFRKWRKFLTDEIHGEPMPLFQPRKTAPEFFDYLAGLCVGTVVLSTPLYEMAPDERSFDDVLDSLYARLVAAPEVASPVEATRPTGRFRQLSEHFRFLKRGMKRHAHVAVGGKRLWMAYRQVVNGELIAIEKVEVANRIGATANEIERLPKIRENLPAFLRRDPQAIPTRCVVLADELRSAFSEQSTDEFHAMREDLEREIDLLAKSGAQVLRSAEAVEQFGLELNGKLPFSESSLSEG